MSALRTVLSPTAAGLLTILLGGCTNASGELTGGEPLFDAGGVATNTNESANQGAGGCPTDGGKPGFRDLYACYFSVCGNATCHSIAGDEGSVLSGFVCGSSAASCYMGMTQTTSAFLPPIVPSAGAADATTTGLWAALYVSSPPQGSGDNMPLAPTYLFTERDLASIRTWIQGGALNN